MPKVNFVKSARKAQPDHGIQIGDSYYWWEFNRVPGKRVSKTYPKQSQLTTSDFLSRVWGIGERIGELSLKDVSQDLIDEFKGELEELRDECQEKLENMPEGLQQGPTGELLQGRADSCDEMINELDNIDVSSVEELDIDADSELTEEQEQIIQHVLDELQQITYNGE